MNAPSATLQHNDPRISYSLLMLRLGVGLVFFMWTLDKLLNPEHAAGIFERYYMIAGLGTSLMLVVGVLQMGLVLAFIAGFMRKWSYGLIFLLHAVSTFSAYKQYMNPWEKPNLLFFAAFPMLAACFALWLLRDYDSKTVDGCLRDKSTKELPETEPASV